jgi:hypothetical protein
VLTTAGAVNALVTVEVGSTFLHEQAFDNPVSSSTLPVFSGGAGVKVPLVTTWRNIRFAAAYVAAYAALFTALRTIGAGVIVAVWTTVWVVTTRVVETIVVVLSPVVVTVLSH